MAIERIAYLTAPLAPIDGEEALRFAHLTGEDHVGACFRYELLAGSLDPDIKANDLLGKTVSIAVTTDPDAPDMVRHFHGMVDEFQFEGNDEEDRFLYRLVLRPLLWLLSKTTDNRIFQHMSADEIIQSILVGYETAFGRIRRTYFKSVGGILALQQSIADRWTAAGAA